MRPAAALAADAATTARLSVRTVLTGVALVPAVTHRALANPLFGCALAAVHAGRGEVATSNLYGSAGAETSPGATGASASSPRRNAITSAAE